MADWREQAKAALEEAMGHGYSSLDNFLNALVDAAAPAIRADEREKAAARVDALPFMTLTTTIVQRVVDWDQAVRAALGEEQP